MVRLRVRRPRCTVPSVGGRAGSPTPAAAHHPRPSVSAHRPCCPTYRCPCCVCHEVSAPVERSAPSAAAVVVRAGSRSTPKTFSWEPATASSPRPLDPVRRVVHHRRSCCSFGHRSSHRHAPRSCSFPSVRVPLSSSLDRRAPYPSH